jgi:hypothetical protein
MSGSVGSVLDFSTAAVAWLVKAIPWCGFWSLPKYAEAGRSFDVITLTGGRSR